MQIETNQQSMYALTQFLSTELDKRKISKSEISRNTSLSYSTVHRSFSGEREFTELEMVEVLCDLYQVPAKALEVAIQYNPTNTTLINLLSSNQKAKNFTPKEQKYFEEESTFVISNLIHTGYFKTVNQVQTLYGVTGVGILYKMQADGIIHIKPGCQTIESKMNYSSTTNGQRKQIQRAVNYHKDSNCGQMKNYSFFGTRLISKERRNLIHKLTHLFVEMTRSLLKSEPLDSKFLNRLSEIIDHSSSIKETNLTEPCFIGLIYDDFLPQTNKQEFYQ